MPSYLPPIKPAHQKLFVLALLATRAESYPGLAILVAFCCLTVVPLVWLDVTTHRRGGK